MFPGHPAARAESTRAGGGPRAAFRVQRYVEALPAGDRGPGGPGPARARSLPYYQPFESGGRSGAPLRVHPFAEPQPASRRATQTYALAITAAPQPGTWAGPPKAQRPAGQQAGHRSRLGLEGDLLPFLVLPIGPLGRCLSRLLVLPRPTQPSAAHEKGGPHVACTRTS